MYYFPMTYGERLKLAMDKRGVDRKTLAEAIGTGRHAIGMVITGGGRDERWLSRENNQKAAKFLKVDSHWLFTGEGEMVGRASASITMSPPTIVSSGGPSSQPIAPVEPDKPATETIATYSVFARAIAQLYDSLPDDAQVRAVVFAEVCDAIMRTKRQLTPVPLPAHPDVPLPKKLSV